MGKPVFSGFEFQFSEAMNPATAGNAGNYEVDWLSTKRVKRKTVQIFHPLAVHAQYNAATNSVSLLLSNQQKFAKGGRITLIATPPGGVSGAAGVALDGNDEGVAGDDGVFTILANAGNHAWIGSVKHLTPSNHCTTDAEAIRCRILRGGIGTLRKRTRTCHCTSQFPRSPAGLQWGQT